MISDLFRPAHVGLNLIYLVPGDTGGTEIYARELIPELVAHAPDVRFTAFINREAGEAGSAPWTDLIRSVVIPVRATNRREWVRGEQQLLPPAAQRHGVNLVHSLGNTAPVWGRFTRVVTIHDLMYRVVPDAHLGLRGKAMSLLVPLGARRAQRVITDSQSTADDLQRLLGVGPERVDVVPLGLGARRAPAAPEAAVRATLGEPERPLALTVSALRPHKNLIRLIDAIALIAPERRPLLVVVGYSTDYEADLRRQIDTLGIGADVRVLGWVDTETLEGLYAISRAFVFPSLYEGFGLPVLEAMARNLPVACSGQGSLREVVGNAALTFDPRSRPEIASAIERLMAGGPDVEQLRAAGRARAARFTWAATARATLAAYRGSLGAVE